MASTDPTLKDISNTVFMLNAWDKKRFEEPDYKKRLEAFKLANQRLAAMETIDVQYLTPVIHNSFLFHHEGNGLLISLTRLTFPPESWQRAHFGDSARVFSTLIIFYWTLSTTAFMKLWNIAHRMNQIDSVMKSRT